MHLSYFAYACKMRCPLNLVLENSKYLWFYSTFCIVILDYGLKLHKLSNHTLVILQKWLEIHFIIVWSLHCVLFSAIFATEKFSENIFDTLIKVKLLVSKTSDSCFQGFDFFQMLLASHRYWKYQTSSLIFIKDKESLQEGWIPKISVACISCTSCQQTRSISSSRQHRISTQVGMQHHIYLLSSLIISFYILTKFLLCYMFSKGHITLT